MGVFRQTWVLTKKNLLIIVRRHWFSTIFRALILPIVYIFLISYVRNFFLPPSVYGFGEANPIRNASTGFQAQSSRDRIVLIDNGFDTGDIASVINELNSTYSAAGANVQLAGSEDDLAELCRSSLTGTSRCYGAVSFTASPSQGAQQINGGQMWAYTAFVDWGLSLAKIDVNSNNNDAQIIVLPLIKAVDDAIARAEGQQLPQTMYQLPFTSRTLQEREDQIQQIFMSALVRYLGLVVFIAVCGITYHLPGHVAREREMGMSSLIDIMNPQKRQWLSHAARILATNISFTAIYMPGVLAVAGIISALMFLRTSSGMVILFNVLACMSLSAYSAFLASFFKRAQLSGITIVIISCLLAIVAQWAVPSNTIIVAVLAVLFPSANYVYWVMYIAEWESTLRGAPWSGLPRYSDLSAVPGWYFYVAFFVQILVFPLLTLWSEKARYGTSSARRKTNNVTLNSPHAISLVGFSKTYYPSIWARMACWKNAKPVQAVSDLTFAALRGQLVALLGRNGAGKSTTMAAITAQEKFSSGLIEMDGGGGLGFCPQKNVLWDELTVLEHVRIFNQLKAKRTDSKDVLRSSVEACDLLLKIKAKSKTLSGGQKRKLQLAMAFTGGSKVCCVDEASSGLDPVSRRKIWDILLSERGHRTILFTTHALDEADALADHIVMMEQGKLTMAGSAVELKQRHGGDYRISLQQIPDTRFPADLRASYTREKSGAHAFHIAEPSQVGQFVAFLEKQGIHDYEVQGPTIETVFLRQAEQDPEQISVFPKNDAGPISSQAGYLDLRDFRPDTRLPTPTTTKARPVLPEARKLSFLTQWWVLYRKRLTILPRSWVPYFFALLIPIVVAYVATNFLRNFDLLVCSPSALISAGDGVTSINSLQLFWGEPIPVGPSSEFDTNAVTQLFGSYGVRNSLQMFDTYGQWSDYIRENYMSVSPGGLFLGNTSSDIPTMAYLADTGAYYAAAMLSVSDSYLMDIPIASSFSTFALPIPSSTGDSLQLIIYFGLAMAIVPGLFALYPSYERLRNIRALQYSNGVRPGPLWLAHLAFDAFFVLAVSVAALAIFVSVRSDAWYSAGHLWPVFFFYGLSATLFSYVVSLGFKTQLGAFAFAAGWQALGLLIYFFLYLILLAFSQADGLRANLMVVQFTLGFITPSGNLMRAMLLSLNQSQIACDGQGYIPAGSMQVYGGPIFVLILQIVGLYAFLVAYDSGWFAGFGTKIGSKVFFWKERGATMRSRRDPEKSVQKHYPPADVVAETLRTEESANDALKVLHISKKFGRSKDPAVDDLTFGIKHGEVYASLGPNGAGKTTTISLIRSTLKPTAIPNHESNIVINNHPLLHSSPSSHSSALLSLGTCPQFDAIDLLTVSQHLAFYARAAGIPRKSLPATIEHILEATGLTPLKDRQAATLSGGNKRKLMLAVAVVGGPKVLVLDEMSSGMDAVSKRVVWSALQGLRGLFGATTDPNNGIETAEEGKGMAILITTHSMEEVAALADRVGIMKKRMLAVGTKGELIRRYGDRWHVHLLLRRSLRTGERAGRAEREREEGVKRWIEEGVRGARVEREMLHGQVRFWVPRSGDDGGVGGGSGLAEVFRLLEANKERLGIEYYSVVQTNLEDVFLNVVGQQEDE